MATFQRGDAFNSFLDVKENAKIEMSTTLISICYGYTIQSMQTQKDQEDYTPQHIFIRMYFCHTYLPTPIPTLQKARIIEERRV